MRGWRGTSTGAAAASAALALALAGCGGSGGFVINPLVVENAIQVSIAEQQHVLSIVTCPPGKHAHTGGHFLCTVTFANGSQGTVTVTEKDDRGDVHYSGLNGFAHGRQVG